MKLLNQLLLLVLSLNSFSQQKKFLLIGTYTSGKSDGIYVYDFNTKNANSKFISSVKTSNPSFITVSPNQKTVYAVNENADSSNNGGQVSSFAFNHTNGQLQFINKQSSGGNDPCYVTCDKTGNWLFAGNYSSGNFSLFPLNKDGSIGIINNTVQHFGKSVNKERQQAPHVHGTFLSADNRFLFIPDLGLDKLMAYQFDAATGELLTAKEPFVQLNPGAGPRHLALHPSQKYLYLSEEMAGAVAAFIFSKATGKLKLFQQISAVPEKFMGKIGLADIHVSPDGKFLYVSNRGEANTITIYSINPATGVLSVIGYQPVFGKTPRNFNFDPSGNYLLVANQESDSIVVFKINHKTGLLTDTGKRINVPNPVCIKWITEKP